MLKTNVIAGYVLSCVGDERAYSQILSPTGQNLSDNALESALIGKENTNTYSFLERGSDERQYCSPNINLPICGFSRSKYGTYPEYHTSDDNLDVVTQEGLEGSFAIMKSIIDSLEFGCIPILKTIGEPQLGKRGLYKTQGNVGEREKTTKNIENLIAYADGTRTLYDICILCKMSLEEGLCAAKALKSSEILELNWI